MRRTILYFSVLVMGLMALQAQPLLESDKIVESRHRLSGDDAMGYMARAGYLTLKNEEKVDRAHVYFTAYHKEGVSDPADRPITFVFNGGPGSSSVWLHMGGLGPKRVTMKEDGDHVAPPYGYEDNPYTWLTETDLVFIDPMNTGYTRPADGVEAKEFLGLEKDLELVGGFIHAYLAKYEYWAAPKFIAGESYGTTRASALSAYLQQRYGLYVNGLMLISSVLDFATLIEARGNDLAPLLVLPTMAATAWYHGKADKRFETVEELLEEVEAYTLNEYALALMKGDQLSEKEEKELVKKLGEYTGLSEAYLRACHFRLEVGKFNKELLRDQGKTVGRLDSRFQGVDYDDVEAQYEYDPSYNRTIYGSFTTALNDYLGRELGFKSMLPYEILTGRARPWPYGRAGTNRYVNVADRLRSAMSRNPDMHVWVSSGYYDMATPYFATNYTFDHMWLRDGLKDNVYMTYYPSGHMVYIHYPSLKQMKEDLKTFLGRALGE